MAPRGQSRGIEIWLALKLHNALGNPIGVNLFLTGVLEELFGHRLRMNATCHVVVALVTQDTHNLGRQSFVQNSNHLLTVSLVTFSHRASLEVLARTLSQCVDI